MLVFTVSLLLTTRCRLVISGKFYPHPLAALKDPNRSHADDGKKRRKKKLATNPMLDEPDRKVSGKGVRAALHRFVANFLTDA